MTRSSTWMPLYVGDYLADTARLTVAQHGAYLLLIMDYWRNGPPPDDDPTLARIIGASAAEWRRLRPAIAGFFRIADGRWHHGRVETERAKAEHVYEGRIRRAKAGAQARWGDASSNAPSIPQALPDASPPSIPQALLGDAQPQPQPQPHRPDPESNNLVETSTASQATPTQGKPHAKRNGTRLPDDWNLGDDDRQFAAEQGLDPQAIDRTAAEFADYWRAIPGARGRKLDWSATWRNRVRAIAHPTGNGNGRGRPPRPSVVEIYADVARQLEDDDDNLRRRRPV